MSGRILIDLFTTLDGVAQAPGGPDEDPSGGFPWGGWQAPLWDDAVGEAVMAGIRSMDALLLGRRTYDIFAAYWPQHADGEGNGEIGRIFTELPKYVVSRQRFEPAWTGTTLIGGDVVAEVAALRARHREIHVIGSVDFVQTLLQHELYDELVLWMYPVVLGQGKRVFPEGAAAANLKLLAPAVTGSAGAVTLRYAPNGVPTTGEM